MIEVYMPSVNSFSYVENLVCPSLKYLLQITDLTSVHLWIVNHQIDIDECKEKKACQCPECSCKNTWGSYECTCSGELLYIRDHDTCISEFFINSNFFTLILIWIELCSYCCFLISTTGKRATEARSAWTAVWVILLGLAMAAGGAYLVYKYRLRVSLVHGISIVNIGITSQRHF